MNQQPRRTLLLWVVWASAALMVYVLLYRDTDIWSFVEADSSRITWLIMALFGFGIVTSLLVAIAVTLEAQRAATLDALAREGGLRAIVISSPKRAADRFFHSIQSTLTSKGQPDVEALLNIELAGYERMSHSVEVLGNILITMGLIGTVMGLTLTLTGLTSSLDALGHDQEMLLAGLRQAMSGMGTAFYTTLLGAVLGGVLLRMFAQITQNGVEGLHDNLMRTCLVHCSADYVLTTEREVRHLNDELKALQRNIEALENVFGASQKTIVDFRKEIEKLDQPGEQGGEPLHVLLERHKAYCEMLRQEMHMLAHMDRPWYIKWREIFRSRKG